MAWTEKDKAEVLLAFGIFVATAVFAMASISQCGNGRKESRAYVVAINGTILGLEQTHPLFGSPNEFRIELSFVNYGKTPAINPDSSVDYRLFPYDAKKRRDQVPDLPSNLGCPWEKRIPGGSILPAGAQWISSGESSFPLAVVGQTASIFSNPPAKIMVVFGCVRYDDVFHERHCSRFAGVYRPDLISRGIQLQFMMKQHNGIDDCE